MKGIIKQQKEKKIYMLGTATWAKDDDVLLLHRTEAAVRQPYL